MNSIDIDVGGTFTDLVLNFNGKALIKKSPTTPYDLSVCFTRVIEDGAAALGMRIEDLLPAIEMIRYSTTIALNRLIEKKGPRLGLITTEGHEDVVLLGRGAQWIDGTRVSERRNLAVQNKPDPLIPRDMIVGVKERVDSRGHIIRPLDENDVREKVRYLTSRGARGFVVALLWGFLNPANERRVKEIIRDEYKEFHIGYLPVVLAGQVVGKLGEYERTMAAILDAYLQRSMQIELSAMWDKLREKGYSKPLLMIQSSGGIAEVFRTAASRTFNSGPVSGLMGAHHVAKILGYQNVVMTDMGGTSFDVGLVVKDSVRSYDFRPIIDRWMVGITMIKTLSIGAGGGSIAYVNKLLENRVQVGPRSAGSIPGPACFNLGGTNPTVTDADVVLGYLNPEYYFGGKMRLDKNRAIQSVREKIAKPLGIGVEEAAVIIRKIVNGNMASAIMKEVHLRGHSPEDFILFVGGGAGPTHAEGYKADIPKAVTFAFSPVFCAFGSSTMDIMHVYEVSKKLTLMEPRTQTTLERICSLQRNRRRSRRTSPPRSHRRRPESKRRLLRPGTRHALRRPIPRETHSLSAARSALHRRRPRHLRRLQQRIQRSLQPLRGKSRRRHLHRKLHPESDRPHKKNRAADAEHWKVPAQQQPAKANVQSIGRQKLTSAIRQFTHTNRCAPETGSKAQRSSKANTPRW